MAKQRKKIVLNLAIAMRSREDMTHTTIARPVLELVKRHVANKNILEGRDGERSLKRRRTNTDTTNMGIMTLIADESPRVFDRWVEEMVDIGFIESVDDHEEELF